MLMQVLRRVRARDALCARDQQRVNASLDRWPRMDASPGASNQIPRATPAPAAEPAAERAGTASRVQVRQDEEERRRYQGHAGPAQGQAHRTRGPGAAYAFHLDQPRAGCVLRARPRAPACPCSPAVSRGARPGPARCDGSQRGAPLGINRADRSGVRVQVSKRTT